MRRRLRLLALVPLVTLASIHGVSASGISASPDYPPASWVPASTSNYTSAARPLVYPVDMIVIHDTETSYAFAIQLFQDPARKASAHYVVSRTGLVTQMVAERDIAWHAGNWDYNSRSIGIEHEGYASVPGYYTTAEYQASARLSASICSRWGVPMDRQHVIGHSEVPDPNHPGLYGGEEHHSDPGPYWNWSYYMGLAQAYARALPSPPHVPEPLAVGGDGSVTLTWSGRSCYAPIDSYQVVGQPGNISMSFPGTTTSATFTGLQNWVKYSFTVTATNSFGTDSLTSNMVMPVPNLGGSMLSDPDVTSSGAGALDVFDTGTDLALWHRSWDGTKWSDWESLGGKLDAGPTAVTRTGSGSTRQLDVFGRGLDNALWHRWWDGTAWHPWESLGGVLNSGPDAASSGAGRIDVFARGSDNSLWHRSWIGGVWQPWEGLGGRLNADPGSVSWAAGRVDVFAPGMDDALWHRWWDASGWHPWESLGGLLFSAADASSCGSGLLDVFAQGADRGLWRRSYNGSWGQWTEIDGDWRNGPGATCHAGTTLIDLVKRGDDNALWWLQLPA